MYQDNKSQLIWCQIIHCVLFLLMGTLFSVMYSSTANDEACDDQQCLPIGEEISYQGCYF